MANGRFISRSISMNEQLAGVSLAADYFFRGAIPHADVEGRVHGNPQIIKGVIFPLRNEITAEAIPSLIEELGNAVDAAGRSLVVWYEVGSQRVLMFPRFGEHQQGLKKGREAASRLPSIDMATRILAGSLGNGAPVRIAGGSTPDQLRTNSGVTPELVLPLAGVHPPEVQGQAQDQVQVQHQGDVDRVVDPSGSITPVDLAVWANSAISQRWGEQPSPLTPTTAGNLAEELNALGVDRETARLSMLRQCQESKKERPSIGSIAYFGNGIKADHEADLTRQAIAAAGELATAQPRTGRRGNRSNRKVDPMYAQGFES